MSGCGRTGNLGPPQHLLLSIYRVHPFCLCDSVTCLTSSIKNFPSLTSLGWVPKILARFASCGNTLYPIAPLGETALAASVSQFSAMCADPSQPRPAITGTAKTEDRRGDSGGRFDTRFCPNPNPIVRWGKVGPRERSDRSPNAPS